MLPKSLRPLLPYLKRYRWGYVAGTLFVFLTNGIWILFPLVLGKAADDLHQGVTRHKLLLYAGALLAIATTKGIFQFLTRWIVIGVSRDIEFDLRNDLFARLEGLSYSYYQRHRTGDIMARATNDLSAVRNLLGPAIMYTANTIVLMTGALAFMVSISPRLTLYTFLPLPAASILIQYFGRRIHDRFERIQAMFSDISARAQENFSGARLIRAYVQEDAEIRAFESENQEYIRRSLRLVRLMGMLWPTLEFMMGCAVVLVLWLGGREVAERGIGVCGKISVGQFVSFSTYMMQLTWPIIALGYVINLFQRGTASLVRLNEIMQEQPEIKDAPGVQEHEGDRDCRRDRVPQTQLQLRRQAGPARPEPARARRQQPGDCRSHRLRQDNPGQPDPAHLRRRARNGSDRWPSGSRVFVGFAAQEYWIRSPGNLPVQRPHPREHCLGSRLRHQSRDSQRRQGRQHRHRHRELPRRLQHHGRRTRHHPLRRPEAAHRHCPRPDSQSRRF